MLVVSATQCNWDIQDNNTHAFTAVLQDGDQGQKQSILYGTIFCNIAWGWIKIMKPLHKEN